MELANTCMHAALAVFVYMTILYLVALWRQDNSVADVAWGPGFILAAWSTLFLDGSFSGRQLVTGALVSVWGLRLAFRIYLRNRGRGEDERYRKWREEWGRSFIIRSYLQVFLLQGAILLLNSAPVLFINSSRAEGLGLLDLAGVLVWVLGFSFESVADWQLDRFIRNPENRGKIMDRGLWRYSRHPNYFGEVTMWWGIYLIALSVPWGWASIIGPLTISYIILFVSGVPMTERFMENNPAFADYKRRTSAFFPWLPGNG